MTTTIHCTGRFCNHLIRNLAVSMIAEKNNLWVEYSFYNEIKQLGIPLFVGEKKYNRYLTVQEEDIMEFLEYDDIESNLYIIEHNTFQRDDFTNHLYNYFRQEIIQQNIINQNPFQDRYNQNNDCFIHIRLGDVAHMNPGFIYYDKILSQISFDQLYISSDQPDHEICQNILKKYPTTKMVERNEIETIQFASTNKHIILSHGSFSACIGYLAFYSDVYYPRFQEGKIWHGSMFSIPGWNCIDF